MKTQEHGADFAQDPGLAAEPTPTKTREEKLIALHALGVEWEVAPDAVDDCRLKGRLVGYVVGGSVYPEPCDAFLVHDGVSELVTSGDNVPRPSARLALLERLYDNLCSDASAMLIAS